MNREQLDAAFHTVREFWPGARPSLGLILGSGWGEAVGAFAIQSEMAYDEIPGLGRTGVEGHAGKLAWALWRDLEMLVFQGRRHYYEGGGWTPVALPIRILLGMGVNTVVLTNAAGGIRTSFKPGDLMLIEDHINGMGANPLQGPHDPIWGPRFPDQSAVYDPDLRAMALDTARAAGLPLDTGIYYAASGPAYETPAEIRAYRALGADAVGMSTATEALLARAAGLRVLGLSCITNLAAGISPTPLAHEEVAAAGRAAMPRIRALLEGFIDRYAQATDES